MTYVLITLTGILLLSTAAHGNLLDKYITDMLDSMDRDADPCEDFQQFVCGNWAKRYCSTEQSKRESWKLRVDLNSTFTTFLENLKSQSDLTEVDKLVRDNYEFCMKSTLNEEKFDINDDYNTAMNLVNISTNDGESNVLHIIRFGAAVMREIDFSQHYVSIGLDYNNSNWQGFTLRLKNSDLVCDKCKNDTEGRSCERTEPLSSKQAVAAYLGELLQVGKEEISKFLHNYTANFTESGRCSSKQYNVQKSKEIMVRRAIETWRVNRKKDRLERCIDFIETQSLDAFLRSYSRRVLKREVVQLKAELDMFVNLITGAFSTMITTNRWMPLNEKVSLIKHIDDLHYQLSLTDWYLSEESVLANSPRYIANLTFVENDRRACQSKKDDLLKKLMCFMPKRPPKDLVFGAKYIKEAHSLGFRLGALLEPSFVAGSELQAIRFGRLGVVVGHELIHSVYLYIKNKAKELGGFYNVSNEAVQKCVIDIYKTAISRLNLTGDASETVFEDIPDIEGMKLSHLAYTFQKLVAPQPAKPLKLANFTDDQLFFISNTNILCDCKVETASSPLYSKNRLRAEIPAWEMPQFGKAFQCKSDSTYSTRKRCKLYSDLNLPSETITV